MSPTFDQFAERVLLQARMVGRAFTKPDDDWAPVALIDTPRGIGVVAIDTDYFADYESKQELAEQVLPALIREHKVRKIALVTSAWMSVLADRPEARDAMARGELRPSQDPDRVEVVWITVMDAEVKRAWMAPILRSRRKPPKLGPWTRHDESADSTLSGLLVDSVIEALR